MQTQATVAPFHGKRTPRLSSWQQEQTAKQQYSKTTFRQPHFDWRSKDTAKYRAGVTVYLTLTDNQINTQAINVVVSRGYYRGGERRYNHISLASLRRLSSIAPLPLLTDEQFTAINEALVADEMLAAGKAQAFRLPDHDRINAHADADIAVIETFEKLADAAMVVPA
jgi:hypothetical protein